MAKVQWVSLQSQGMVQALALIREHGELNDKQLMQIHDATGIDILDVLAEDSQWFVLDDKELGAGVPIKNDTMTVQCEEIVRKDDQIRVLETDAKPIDSVLGIDVYKGIHLNQNSGCISPQGR